MADLQTAAPEHASPSGHARPRPSSPSRRAMIGGVVAAVVVGVVLGIVTAPSSASKKASGGTKTGGQAVADSRLAPTPSTITAARSAGRAVNVDLDQANRTALKWAFYQAYTQGKLTVAQKGLQPTAVTIPQGIKYGAVEGATAAQDEYYAISPAYFAGTANPDTSTRYAWKRTGTGPWGLIDTGRLGVCDGIPRGLIAVLALGC